MSNTKNDNPDQGKPPEKKRDFFEGFDKATDKDWADSGKRAEELEDAQEKWVRDRIKKKPEGTTLKI